MTDKEIKKLSKIECKKLLHSDKGYNGISFQDFWEEGVKFGIASAKTENEKLTKLTLSLIRWKSEKNEKEYEKEIYNLVKYFEEIGKIELAEYVLAQIGVNAWMPQSES